MLTPWHWALLRLHDGKKQEPVTPTESKQRFIGSCMCFPSAANQEDARGLFCRSKSRTVRLIVVHGSKNCSEKKKEHSHHEAEVDVEVVFGFETGRLSR